MDAPLTRSRYFARSRPAPQRCSDQRRPARFTPPFWLATPGPLVPTLLTPTSGAPAPERMHSSTAAISRGSGLIDSWVHNADAGRTATAVSQGARLVDAGVDRTATRRPHARRHRGGPRCRARNAAYGNSGGAAVDSLGGRRGRGRSRCRSAYHAACGDARCSAVNHGGVGGSNKITCGNSQQQRRCLQHFCTPFMIGHDTGHSPFSRRAPSTRGCQPGHEETMNPSI